MDLCPKMVLYSKVSKITSPNYSFSWDFPHKHFNYYNYIFNKKIYENEFKKIREHTRKHAQNHNIIDYSCIN